MTPHTTVLRFEIDVPVRKIRRWGNFPGYYAAARGGELRLCGVFLNSVFLYIGAIQSFYIYRHCPGFGCAIGYPEIETADAGVFVCFVY
ncbi:hypothetical protein [Microcoleus sp. FACHB-672]|uniref:hypothetical protein n=1 Tax=Microcoleus sp. FACHB-672 TaxID=2692825 RepID=UPI0016866C55|nr:hypothetical protein [Microcoleus sp. FACHB-672]MBD2042653.1 hypothetical protein [Microcoleus sp. FACHB-672]